MCDPVFVHICRNPAGSADPPPFPEASTCKPQPAGTFPGWVGEEGNGADDGQGGGGRSGGGRSYHLNSCKSVFIQFSPVQLQNELVCFLA